MKARFLLVCLLTATAMAQTSGPGFPPTAQSCSATRATQTWRDTNTNLIYTCTNVAGVGYIWQLGQSPILPVSSAPSGSCTAGIPNQQVVATGTQYSCQGGTWGAIGSGGSGTVNTSTAGKLAYYAADGTAVSGNPATVDSSGDIISPGTVTAGTSVYATGQGQWHRRGPVVYPDFTMTNPYTSAEATVIVEGTPVVLSSFYTTVWKMWYSCGTSICYAESADGVNNWTRYVSGLSQGAILVNYTQSNVIKNGSTYYLFANNRSTGIDLYTATDGVTFSLVQANVITGVNNTGGIFQSGTLYLFAELSASGGTHLYTATTPFTTFADQGKIGPADSAIIRGPSAPYFVNGKWWLWVHVDNSGFFNGSVLERLSASALTGPWTNSETTADLLPKTIDELGGTQNAAQVADPYVLEVNGKTFLYYTSSYADATRVYQHIKLAIADGPLTSVVQTAGTGNEGTRDNLNPLGLVQDPILFNIDFKDQGITNTRSVSSLGPGSFSGGVTSGCLATSGCGSSVSRITINGNSGAAQYTSLIIADFVNSGLTFTCPRSFAGKGFAFQNNAGTTTPVLFDCTAPANSLNIGSTGRNTWLLSGTATNCSSAASPAVCAAAPAGSVVVAAAATTVVVNTTAVTANSQIFVQEDSSLGTKLTVTCNTTPATVTTVSGRVPATSFTITTTAPVTDPRCFSYTIVN